MISGIDDLQIEIKRLKEIYKELIGNKDYADLSEEEKEELSNLNQEILGKEYGLQEVKKKMGMYKKPKKGDWVVVNSKWGYKRVKLEQDDSCGW